VSERVARLRRVLVTPGFLCLAIGLGSALALALFGFGATEWREIRLPDNQGLDLAFFNQSFYLGVHDHGRRGS